MTHSAARPARSGGRSGGWWAALRGWCALAATAAAVVSVAVVVIRQGPPMRVITADFASAPGLYAGNQVDVLGIPVGTVTAVRGSDTGVSVSFRVPRSLPLPADVRVLLLAPQIVSDRYLQLTPAYSGGARLADGAAIARSHTAVPVTVDAVFTTLDQLTRALGPTGANASGAVSDFLHSAATAFGPDGSALHATLTHFGDALGSLSSHGGDLTTLLTSLGSLTATASQNLDTYSRFAADLAAVSTSLAGDNADVATALSTLQQALAQLADFVTTDGTSLTGTVGNLRTFSATIATEQANLAEVLRVLPVSLQNLHAAYNPAAPGGPALTTRFDPAASSAGFADSICGSGALRLLTIALATPANPDNASGEDLVCGLNGFIGHLPVPPGGGSGPQVSLHALLTGAP